MVRDGRRIYPHECSMVGIRGETLFERRASAGCDDGQPVRVLPRVTDDAEKIFGAAGLEEKTVDVVLYKFGDCPDAGRRNWNA